MRVIVIYVCLIVICICVVTISVMLSLPATRDDFSAIACKHEYSASITKHPTDEEKGELLYTCEKCSHTYTVPIEKSAGNVVTNDDSTTTTTHIHNYTSTITKEPTYDAEGERTYRCEACGDVYTEAVEKLQKQVVPVSVRDRTLSGLRYRISQFSISLGELINSSIEDYQIKYYSVDEAINLGYLGADVVPASANKDNVYVAVVSGEVKLNPQIPYLSEYEENAVTVWMDFYDNDKLNGHGIIMSENMHNCAVLSVTSSF